MEPKNLVKRINQKLAPTHFLVTKRRGGERLYHCLAEGDPMTARYEVTDQPVDLAAVALRLGVRLTVADAAMLETEARP